MRKLSYSEAFARIESTSWTELYTMLYDSHKDFYGYKGRYLYNYTKEELLNWFSDHFMWDNDEQFWRNQVPFYEYNPEDM